MIEVEVKMVGASVNKMAPVVILNSKDNKGLLPVGIGLMEAYAIFLGLENKEISRPLTHDLMSNILKEWEIKVIQIEITDLRNQIFYGKIKLKYKDKVKKIDSRPSDAIALALRKEAPIFVAEEVADKAFVYGDPHEYVNSLEFKDQF
ncbi:MAG: bifunctional nuclease family protein [Halanaerobiales bacterium]|nr:bifunctional nuclease family protein [Halanaerobiales bacterium]